MKKNKGMALVEIVIGSAIIASAIIAASSAFSTYVQYALSNQKNIQGAYILEEGLEVMTFFRDNSWLNISRLSTSTAYYLNISNGVWATTTVPQYVDGEFLRSITVSDVKRDSNDDISTSGTYDPNTKLVTATVYYYQGHSTTTKTLSTYLSNIYDN